MTEAQHHPDSGDTSEESYDSPDLVLAALHACHQVATQVEIDKLHLAVAWASMHPVESITQGAATVDGSEGELTIAGDRAPLVAEFCIGDLALALGMSTDAGRTYLGDALEIRHRLPKLWTAVTTGRVAVWKARTIAQATKPLCPQAAAHVDTHLAHKAQRCSYAQIERSVDDALRRHDPTAAEQRRREAADARHFDVDLARVTFDGTVHVDAELDLADALDLNDAIGSGAAALADLGCTESLDVRRSLAAGALARHELTLDLPAPERPAPRQRELVIYVHLTDGADGAVDAEAGVENTRSAVSIEQVKDWCHGTNTHVTVRPVIDLNQDLHTDTYRPTDTMREQAVLTNPTCVYPHCGRPARAADLDHIVEYNGTNTTSHNLAPLCRRHHRYKTHAGWTVIRTGPTTFTWTSPHGYTYDWDTSHTRHTH